MAKVRTDKKGRKLDKGEYQNPDGRYFYIYFHHTFFRDFSFTVSGVSGRFRSDHSSASCGYSVAKSLNPLSSIYPLQYGHLLPSDRVEMRVSHSLPHSLHFHQALRLAKTVTCVGSRGAFLADHSAASSGFWEARSL